MKPNSTDNDELYLSDFYKNWSQAKEQAQLDLIEKAVRLSPGNGIIPVLAGMNSYYFSVRNKSRQVLSYFKTKLFKLTESYVDDYELLYALRESALFSARIYNELKSDLSVQEIRFYFEILLESGGRGPFYAWKFWQTEGLSRDTMKNIVLAVSEKGRLFLADQYLHATPAVRRKFAYEFKKILQSIEDYKSAVQFYAWLFDNRRYADPFLCHLNSDVINPELVISRYIRSSNPETRAEGLKALSMLVPEIDTAILVDFIEDKENPILRDTVFKVIGNAPAAAYSELFDNVYNAVCSHLEPEISASFKSLKISESSGSLESLAVPESSGLLKSSVASTSSAAFHALVVCCTFPLSELVDRIMKNAPHLMRYLFLEISSLSGLAFYFIREMAKNNGFFQKKSAVIYKALIYGIITKRPERMLKLLEKNKDVMASVAKRDTSLFSDNNHRTDSAVHKPFLSKDEDSGFEKILSEFYIKIKTALYREKQLINSEFAGFRAKYQKSDVLQENKSTGIFTTFFSDSAEKKIKMLIKGSLDGSVDFNGQTICNACLSSGVFDNPILFDNSIIKDCDMSYSAFPNSSFRGTVFLNVNFRHAKFNGISFDNAVFIDVDAHDAEFVKCSFCKTSFFNTSFKSACMTGAVFVDSAICKASFANADLSDATFACSQISFVNFTEAYLFNTDFTGIKARFCRFPSHSNIKIKTDYADFSARFFHFNIKDIPDALFNKAQTATESENAFINDINLLIFAECIHFGRKMFLRQNKFSLLTAFDIFKSKPCDLFEIVPLLIHENIDFPGFDSVKEKTPCGISGYCPSPETGIVAAKYLPRESLKFRAHTNCYIESLFTIGSTGTIAQSSDSDIDYWVCVRNGDSEDEKRLKLGCKLNKLGKWALSLFKTEVHFFIVDIEKAKMDDFGTSSEESSGSAQGKILKEEFYRTMLYVAGKLPLWCVLPVHVSKNYYEKIFSMICVTPESCRYIDLGDIHEIPAGEYLGASIWQMFKWLKSPFKSVIKISLLDQFIQESGRKPLLCNVFKERWMNPRPYFELSRTDPYYILLISLIRYYNDSGNSEATRFIQLCFFLKTGISSISDLDSGVFGFRRFFITKCMEKWGWERESVFKFGGFKNWQYDSIVKLSLRIEKYMIDTYRRVRRGFHIDAGNDKLLIKPEDKIALGRRMFVQFSDKPHKIRKILLISKHNDHFQGLNLRLCKNRQQEMFWELIHKSGKIAKHKEEILKRARTIEEIGAWLVYNEFYSRHTLINLIPNPSPVTYDEIRELFDTIHNFFHRDIYETEFNVLIEKEVIDSLFVSINFSVPRNMKKIYECSVIYTNSWGEMFFIFISEKKGFDSIEQVVKRIGNELAIDSFPEKTIYYFPKKFKHIFN